jgi:hypothetical protein
MRQHFACISLVVAILAAGCGSGGAASGVDADLKKSDDELRKEAEGMSVADLEKKVEEIKNHMSELDKAGGDDPSKAAETKAKLMGVLGIYGAELNKRKMK